MKDNKLNIAEFKVMVAAAWGAVDQGLIDRLVDSMPRRLAVVKRAKGWYTKY